jgi:DNA topoisomerase-1
VSAHGTDAPAVGLCHVSDADPGIRRTIRRGAPVYLAPDGSRITDPAMLARLTALAIPPAWTDVWICANPAGHLQAVGRDAKGRKQYRYHAEFTRLRDADKYGRMLRFARRLPRIREAVEADLARPGMPREKVLALVVRLLELTHLRVGNEEYARLNRSYGLTTLRDRHATVKGSQVRFRFTGKSGKQHEVGIRDRRLARLIRRIQELPGQHLFEYLDEHGERRAIRSDDVNGYLRSVAGADVTAKDFRTWAATVLAFRILHQVPGTDRQAEARRRIKAAIEQVAERLGNTATVCRASYVHPVVVESWQTGDLARVRLSPGTDDDAIPDLAAPPDPAEEAAVIRLLERKAREARRQPRATRPGAGTGTGRSRGVPGQPSARSSVASPDGSSSGRRSRSRTSVTPTTDSTTPSR